MQWFVDSPLLTLFFCIGVGSIFGRIPFGPVSFGPAGALFVALALSAIEPDVALAPIITNLSLCVFCYMVGIAAGPSFVNALRSGWQPVVVSILAILAMAIVALSIGAWFDLDIGTVAGAFAGAGTATAALGAVQQQLSVDGAIPPEPAIGYAVAYPITVFLTILACSYLMSAGRRKPTPEDREKVSPFVVRTLELVGDPDLTIHGLSERYEAVVSRLTRGGSTVVAHEAERLSSGDMITVTGRENVVDQLVTELGRPAAREPWMDRSDIDFRRITLSNSAFVGRELHDLRMEEQFDAVVSRVRRGDIDIIATPDLILQSGDRLRVTAPRERLGEITKDLGDSERTAGDINPVGLGLGLTIGLILAFLQIPLPGGGTLVLGTATAPLVAGRRPRCPRANRSDHLGVAGQRVQHAESVRAARLSCRGRHRRGAGAGVRARGQRGAVDRARVDHLGGACADLCDWVAHRAALRHGASTGRTDRLPTESGTLRLCDRQSARPTRRGRLRRPVPGQHDRQGVPGAADGRVLLRPRCGRTDTDPDGVVAPAAPERREDMRALDALIK